MWLQGYAAKYVQEYVEHTVGKKAPNVGEYWTDMHWEGSTLGHNQNAARQALCDVLDETENALNLFDFPTKGILQVCGCTLQLESVSKLWVMIGRQLDASPLSFPACEYSMWSFSKPCAGYSVVRVQTGSNQTRPVVCTPARVVPHEIRTSNHSQQVRKCSAL